MRKISINNSYISDFSIGDLRSGQFCDLSILRQWEKSNALLLAKNTLKHRDTCKHDIEPENCTCDPFCVPEAISHHGKSLTVVNHNQIRDAEAWKFRPFRLRFRKKIGSCSG